MLAALHFDGAWNGMKPGKEDQADSHQKQEKKIKKFRWQKRRMKFGLATQSD